MYIIWMCVCIYIYIGPVPEVLPIYKSIYLFIILSNPRVTYVPHGAAHYNKRARVVRCIYHDNDVRGVRGDEKKTRRVRWLWRTGLCFDFVRCLSRAIKHTGRHKGWWWGNRRLILGGRGATTTINQNTPRAFAKILVGPFPSICIPFYIFI